MSAVRAILPYVREVGWELPANIISGAASTFKAIPAALGGATVPAYEAVEGLTGFSQFGKWLGGHISNLGSSFFHHGVKGCIGARDYLKTCPKISFEALSQAVKVLGPQGGVFAGLFLLASIALANHGRKVMAGEYKIGKDIHNGYNPDNVPSPLLHWGKFACGTAILAGGLGAIFAPTVAPVAFGVALTGLAGNVSLSFIKWLIGGFHWFNVPIKAPPIISDYLKEHDFRHRVI